MIILHIFYYTIHRVLDTGADPDRGKSGSSHGQIFPT